MIYTLIVGITFSVIGFITNSEHASLTGLMLICMTLCSFSIIKERRKQ